MTMLQMNLEGRAVRDPHQEMDLQTLLAAHASAARHMLRQKKKVERPETRDSTYDVLQS